MLWFYLTAAMLLIGAELSAALARERTPDEIRRRGEEVVTAEAVEAVADKARRRLEAASRR
jgi:uncharacterized BrkB/YihY/UPF0761 family membrane protein